MKKILSLLSMLMITVMAFATDYKGQLDYTVTTRTGDLTGPSNAQGVLKIEDYAGGKYTVTATGCDLSSIELGNWDEIICEGVEGTTDANGVTTINVAPYAFRGSDNAELKNAKLFVKFKGDKAYATFEGTYNPNLYANYKLKYTFGVDEGFDGGGSTGGGEDKPAAFEKVNFVGDGTNFNWSIPVNWDTQKIVMSIDPSTCTGNCEDIIGLGEVATAWNNTLHLYRKTDKTLQGYFQIPGGSNNNTNPFDETNPIKVEVSKAQGFVVNGVVKIPASQMSALFALSTVNMGTGEGANDKSRATYNYVKVVDKDWTEVPPVTVKDTKKFENVAYTTSMGGSGTATVTFTEMSDDTFPMTFVSDDLNVKAENLTKGTDTKGRTTYTGEAVNDAASTVTYTVNAVVYSEDATQKLYMTMVSVDGTTFTVGENPDAVTESSNKKYTSNLRILDGETTVVEEAEANVNIIKYSDESYKVTLKDVNILNKTQDLVFVGSAIVEEGPAEGAQPLTIMAKSDEATTTVFGEQVSGTFEITEVSADEIKMGFSMESQNFSYMGEFNYTEEEEPEVYTNNLHIYDAAAPETDLFQADQAKVEFLATATGEFKLTLKDVTLNENTQDLVFTGMLSAPEPGGQDPLAEEGETTPAEPAMVLNAIADEATATFLGATSATAVFNVIMNDEAETENDAFALTFAITAGEKTLGGEFNYEKTPDVEEYPINFDKTAKSTHNSRALNSFSLQQTGKDKQTESVYASKAAYEDHTSKVFTVEAGSELTASFDYTGEWMHSFVYIDFDNDGQFSYKEEQWDQTGTDLVAFSFYSLDSNPKNDASGYNSVGDELTGDARNTYVAPSFKAPAKAGEYRIRFKFDWNCILPGGSSTILEDGGGVWDATLKVVEPVVDGISTINVEAANGEAQLFTVDGVKLNKLQKGLNIVRTADGKVKKVLVK
ncbi:hypothetical protein [Leyella stercorea]|jgi:hypothetical protein|uniref:hypothetical protein n=1 Tax=Leyella stercorea TaxID=363265 RepID=UPI00241C1758|nr:hypothetical protein [Leyella stercorea]